MKYTCTSSILFQHGLIFRSQPLLILRSTVSIFVLAQDDDDDDYIVNIAVIYFCMHIYGNDDNEPDNEPANYLLFSMVSESFFFYPMYSRRAV